MSRAGNPVLHETLGAHVELVEAPVVAGRTVWDAAPPTDGAVVESPNWWGYLETTPQGALLVQRPAFDDRHVAAGRHLARALEQIAGLRVPYGPPDAPWFVVIQPRDAREVALRTGSPSGVSVRSLEPSRPELPGGLRIQLAIPSRTVDVADCVDSVRNAISGCRGQ